MVAFLYLQQSFQLENRMRESKTFGERCRTRFSDEPKRKCLFLCEGEETEPIYFAKLKELSDDAGIPSLVEFIQIEKPRGENWSNPKKMVDALCLDLSDALTYNSLINAMLDSLYTDTYLFRHKDKLQEFENLLVSFVHDILNVNETDLVSDVEKTVHQTLAYFKEQRPRICNIILTHIDEMLQNYRITFEKGFDYLCLVADRDPESFSEWQFNDVVETCRKNGFRFLLSNPNFEFWLLLHFDEVLNIDRDKIKRNDRINKDSKSSIRFVSNELRSALGKYKKNRFNAGFLVNRIDVAIKNEKEFSEDLEELKNSIGSNIGKFIEELRRIK